MNLTKNYYSYDNPFVFVRQYFSMRARKQMYNRFINLCSPSSESTILDLGGTPDTKLKDSNFLEKLYPYSKNITICSIEDCSNIVKKFGLKAFVENHSGGGITIQE